MAAGGKKVAPLILLAIAVGLASCSKSAPATTPEERGDDVSLSVGLSLINGEMEADLQTESALAQLQRDIARETGLSVTQIRQVIHKGTRAEWEGLDAGRQSQVARYMGHLIKHDAKSEEREAAGETVLIQINRGYEVDPGERTPLAALLLSQRRIAEAKGSDRK